MVSRKSVVTQKTHLTSATWHQARALGRRSGNDASALRLSAEPYPVRYRACPVVRCGTRIGQRGHGSTSDHDLSAAKKVLGALRRNEMVGLMMDLGRSKRWPSVSESENITR